MSEGIAAFIFAVKHNCYSCWETCYWHMIEERFCFDESIASYQEPITKEEKNNNLFDNMAFYDSVSVIAGRAVVTIDPIPEKKHQTIIEQPRRLKKEERIRFKSSTTRPKSSTDSLRTLGEENASDADAERSSVHSKEEPNEKEEEAPRPGMKKTVSFGNILTKEDNLDDSGSKSDNSMSSAQVELRKKSLKERRMSKSLSLKIDYPQDMPIIRQSSVPKFFLDTPEENQTESSLIRTPLTALQSPMGDPDGFSFDLKSVVHIENSKKRCSKEAPAVHREASVSRLTHMKRSIKLRKSRSSVSASSIPHTNYI